VVFFPSLALSPGFSFPCVNYPPTVLPSNFGETRFFHCSLVSLSLPGHLCTLLKATCFFALPLLQVSVPGRAALYNHQPLLCRSDLNRSVPPRAAVSSSISQEPMDSPLSLPTFNDDPPLPGRRFLSGPFWKRPLQLGGSPSVIVERPSTKYSRSPASTLNTSSRERSSSPA